MAQKTKKGVQITLRKNLADTLDANKREVAIQDLGFIVYRPQVTCQQIWLH